MAVNRTTSGRCKNWEKNDELLNHILLIFSKLNKIDEVKSTNEAEKKMAHLTIRKGSFPETRRILDKSLHIFSKPVADLRPARAARERKLICRKSNIRRLPESKFGHWIKIVPPRIFEIRHWLQIVHPFRVRRFRKFSCPVGAAGV